MSQGDPKEAKEASESEALAKEWAVDNTDVFSTGLREYLYPYGEKAFIAGWEARGRKDGKPR